MRFPRVFRFAAVPFGLLCALTACSTPNVPSKPAADAGATPTPPVAAETPEVDSPPPAPACPPCVVDERPEPPARANRPVLAARRGSPDIVPVFDEASGLRLISARREEGMTRATVAWPPLDPSRFSRWQIETSDKPTGPFVKRAEGESGADKPGVATFALPRPMTFVRLVRIETKVGKKSATAAIRVLTVAEAEYDIGRRTVPYAPDHSARVRAMVRYPTALAEIDGHVPLAVITHGNAGVCRDANGEDRCEMTMVLEDKCPEGTTPTPSAEGFLWLAESLAARGYVVAVVDANSVNCTNLPLVVQGRTSLILEHLRVWGRAVRGLETPLGDRFAGRIDMERVALIGHSNGAEASAMVPVSLHVGRLQPQLAGTRVSSVIAIAGSDSLWAVPDETPFLVLQASCDMQLPSMDGMRLYDRSVVLRSAPHTAAYIIGATHNGFNLQWHRDDSMDEPSGRHFSACPESGKLSPPRTRALLEATVGDWLLATTRERRRVVPAWLRGDAPMPREIVAATGGEVPIRWNHGPADKLVIESFDGDDAPRHNDLGGLNRVGGFHNGGRCYGLRCDDAFAHAAWAGRFDWREPGARFLFELPTIDASRWKTVALRMTQNPGAEDSVPGRSIDASVRLIDADGNIAVVLLSEIGGLRYPSTMAQSTEQSHFYHGVLETLRLPIARFAAANPKLDLTRINGLELVFDRPGSERGSILLAHVELTRP
ncbi:MAG: hypothetical protein RIT45_3636 [Pseudomonadota bacterium]